MKSQNRKGIIVQARMGSTRLPGKMSREFYDGNSLLEVVIRRILLANSKLPVVIATTNRTIDDYIAEASKKLGVLVFRGNEEDVMSRFIGAAEQYKIDNIIRICADNPFIQPKYIKQLINYNKDLTADYIGFRLNKTNPGIKTHLGFFPERVKLRALKEIHDLNIDAIYKEHVTNYFYSNENDSFLVKWIELYYPQDFLDKARFTVDVESDFEITEKIYRYFNERNIVANDDGIISFLREHPLILKEMENNIRENEK